MQYMYGQLIHTQGMQVSFCDLNRSTEYNISSLHTLLGWDENSSLSLSTLLKYSYLG